MMAISTNMMDGLDTWHGITTEGMNELCSPWVHSGRFSQFRQVALTFPPLLTSTPQSMGSPEQNSPPDNWAGQASTTQHRLRSTRIQHPDRARRERRQGRREEVR